MLLEEKFEVHASREKVWTALRDPAQMMPCIPGCESIEALDAENYTATVSVSLGPIKARFLLQISIDDEHRPERLSTTVSGEEGSRAGQLRASNKMRLTEIDSTRTEVYYASELTLTGRLGRFGLGMMKKTAQRLMARFRESFTSLVETG